MADVTICTVSWNARHALALLWEGYQKYNPDYPAKLAVLDNGSIDGAKEYALHHADIVLTGDNSMVHGYGLAELIRRVDTPYLLLADNDMHFTRPGALAYMMEHMGPDTLCVCPERPGTAGKGVVYGPEQTVEWSPDISCALFRTEVIQKICQHFHLGYYADLSSGFVYETGGMVWRVGQAMGLDSVEPPDMWDYCKHVGKMSEIWVWCPDYPNPDAVRKTLAINPGFTVAMGCYEQIRQELADIRGVPVEYVDEREPDARNVAVSERLEWPATKPHVLLRRFGGGS